MVRIVLAKNQTKCGRCELSEVEKLSLRRNTMKITAGLGSIDEYVRYVEAGADEFSVDTYLMNGIKIRDGAAAKPPRGYWHQRADRGGE